MVSPSIFVAKYLEVTSIEEDSKMCMQMQMQRATAGAQI
jgi:hypothetical protein